MGANVLQGADVTPEGAAGGGAGASAGALQNGEASSIRQDRLALGAIIAVALGLRMAYLWKLRLGPGFSLPNPLLDAALYDRLARSVLAGDWLGGPEALYANNHLYAYFLAVWYALFGPGWVLPRLVQLSLGAVTPVLLYLIGRRAFGRGAGLLAASMGAIYGPFIFAEGLILPSSLAALTVSLALLGLLVAQQRGLGRDWFLAGAAIGLFALTRRNGGILLLPALGWALLAGAQRGRTARIRDGLLVLVGALLTVAPMVERGLATSADPALLASHGGVHFYVGNHSGARGAYSPVPGIEPSPRGHVEDSASLAEKALGRRLTPSEISAYWYRKGLAFIRAKPGQYLRLLGRKLLIALNTVELNHNENSYYVLRRQVAVLRLPLLTFAVVGPLGLLGLLLSVNRWRQIGLVHLAFLAYLGSLLIFFVAGPYRVPLVPPLIVFAGFAIMWMYQRAGENASVTVGAAIAVLVPLALLTQVNVLPRQSQRLTKAERAQSERSARRWVEGRISQMEERVVAGPQDFRAHLRLGDLYRRQEKWSEAAQAFERAAALAPESKALDIRIRLALSLAGGKRYREAKRHWEEVLAMNPPPGIAELGRRHLVRINRAMRSGQPSAPRQKAEGVRK